MSTTTVSRTFYSLTPTHAGPEPKQQSSSASKKTFPFFRKPGNKLPLSNAGTQDDLRFTQTTEEVSLDTAVESAVQRLVQSQALQFYEEGGSNPSLSFSTPNLELPNRQDIPGYAQQIRFKVTNKDLDTGQFIEDVAIKALSQMSGGGSYHHEVEKLSNIQTVRLMKNS